MLESRPDPEDPTVPESLDDLRREIDAIDDRLVSALGERAKVAARIAALKAGAATPSLAPERERAILARISELDASPFDAEHIGAIFREIFSASRSLEKPERVAYLGPPFTFSHQAAQLHFGHSAEFVPMGSFRDVFDAVDASDTAYGVVPIENSTSGTIGETLDLLSEHEVSVFSEIELPISHSLLALEGRDEYTIVYSHAQVLMQCRQWLALQMPRARPIDTPSSADAAERAAGDRHAAAIGPASAGEAYGLAVIRRNIQDVAANRTRFYVIAKRHARRSGRDKTAIVIAMHDRVGALHDVLAVLRGRDVNLSLIQSRPSRSRPGDYLFFLEVHGHPDDTSVASALEDLAGTVVLSRVPPPRPASDGAG